VDLINEFAPEVGDEFTILTAGSILGTFAAVNDVSGNTISYDVTYNATSVVLTVSLIP
jgi:hypothetical protein